MSVTVEEAEKTREGIAGSKSGKNFWYIRFAETSTVLLPDQELAACIEITKFSNQSRCDCDYSSLFNEL